MNSSLSKTDHGLAITGNLVYANVTEIEKQSLQIFEQLSSSNKADFVIDCHQLERIDSAGIALLLEWQRECKEAAKACHFVGIPDQTKSLIKAYQLQSLIAA